MYYNRRNIYIYMYIHMHSIPLFLRKSQQEEADEACPEKASFQLSFIDHNFSNQLGFQGKQGQYRAVPK